MWIRRQPSLHTRLDAIQRGEAFRFADGCQTDIYMRCFDYSPSKHEIVVDLRTGQLSHANPHSHTVPLPCCVDDSGPL